MHDIGSDPSSLEDSVQVVADLGNSRLKWARLDCVGSLQPSVSLSVDDASEWRRVWEDWNPGNRRTSRWGVSSVNPPAAKRLAEFFHDVGIVEVEWFRSADEVPIKHTLNAVGTAGTDRAFAVLAAGYGHEALQTTIVVLCGSAVTVERISSEGIWEGGAIALGLGMTARALHELTAQLPLIAPVNEPPPWGPSTRPALEAGVYWGVVGGIRELLSRQGDPDSIGRVIWTGGDAHWLANSVNWPNSEVHPDLVLEGLALHLFGASGR